MSQLITYAAAKLFIAGEYSVLCNSPALLIALKKYARVYYSPCKNTNFIIKINNTNIIDKKNKLITSCEKIFKKHNIKIHAGKYILDTSDFFYQETNNKLGLGSSAAICAAFCKLILHQNNITNFSQIFELSLEAHNLFSQDLSSGADIATALYAKPIWFKKNDTNFKIKKVTLSPTLENIIIIYTGISQNSRESVARFNYFCSKSPIWLTSFLERVHNSVEALQNPHIQFDHALNIFQVLAQELKFLGQKAQIPIISTEHQSIIKLAHECFGAAKPSGAGGGDCAIALIPPINREIFCRKIEDEGFSILNLSICSSKN